MIAYQNMAHGQKTFTVGKNHTHTKKGFFKKGICVARYLA